MNLPLRKTETQPIPAPRIRRAVDSDAARLSDFMRVTFLAANGHCSSPANVEAFVAAAYRPERQRAEIADPTLLTLIAGDDAGLWSGYVQINLAAPIHGAVPLRHALKIERFYVDAAFHGHGVAQALMQRVLEEAQRVAADGLWLNAWTQAARALAFYARQGFRVVGRAHFVVGDDAKDNLTLARVFAVSPQVTEISAAPRTLQERNLEIAQRYLASIGGADRGAALEFFAADAVQVEFPNRLLPNGATRDLQQLREAAARGAKVMQAQKFDVLHAIASGDSVAVEAQWSGCLAQPFGNIPAGGTMTARFAIFLIFRDGKIVRQHNYDCFDPW